MAHEISPKNDIYIYISAKANLRLAKVANVATYMGGRGVVQVAVASGKFTFLWRLLLFQIRAQKAKKVTL